MYIAQQNNPYEGDFAQLVKDDLNMIGMTYDQNTIENTGVELFKTSVNRKVREAALTHLKNMQQTHTKVKDIQYDELKTQQYLKSPLFSNSETSLLYALRSRTADTFKANFRNMFANVIHCPLDCQEEGEEKKDDTQKHLLTCSKLKCEIKTHDVASGQVVYEDIFGGVKKQKEAIVLFNRLIEARLRILKERENSPPGDDLDPSMGNNCLCCVDSVFTHCINCVYIGK